jgi:DNA polymerase-1
MNERLLILDSNSILHRAFHALPPLATKKGELVNAIYGFLLVLFKLIRELQPKYICACFDFPAPTFRHKKFKEYKAKRPPTPKDLVSQIPKIKEILNSLSIPFFEKEGFEADDLISTISKKVKDKKVSEIYILTGDFDTLQLINEKTKVYILGWGIKESLVFDRKKVIEKFGILPEQMVDFKALVGDPSDNIPGVAGVGKKTAVEILKKYGSIQNLYSKIEEEKGLKKGIKEALIKNKERVLLSKSLVKLAEKVPIDFNLEKSQFRDFDQKKFKKILEKFEFYSLLKRIPEITKKTKKLF